MKFSYGRAILVGVLVFVPRFVLAGDAETTFRLGAGSHLWFNGDSTLHPFSSTATVVEVDLSVVSAASASSPTEKIVGKKFSKFEVRIPVEGLKSGEKGLDKNMYKALKAAEFPTIQFDLESDKLVGEKSTTSEFPIAVQGKLTIAGQTQTIPMEATGSFKDNGIEIRGKKKLFMTDYGVKPPTIMGMIKVRNEVTVVYDLNLEIVP